MMVVSERITIMQSRKLARKIAECSREADIVYDAAYW